MIVGQRKSIEDIRAMLASYKKILILGCGECVTVCCSGGLKEVGVLAAQLRLASKQEGKEVEFVEGVTQRQCESEFIDDALKQLKEAGDFDCILSMACGVGVNFMSENVGKIPVFPALDTTFMGANVAPGTWEERCAGCGKCILDLTGGICPIARCSKSLLNGPCGGTDKGKCEVSKETNCAWNLIVERMTELGTLEKLSTVQPAKDWTTARDGGPRRLCHEELTEIDLAEEE